jgi:hypothetical protein
MLRLALIACLLSLGACQPLYGDKAEHLKNPPPKKKPADAPEAPVEVKYIEDCNADFRKDPKGVKQETGIANDLVVQGDNEVGNGDKSKDPKAAGDSYKTGIDKYRNALIKDPYNVEATLKLAVAYDKVLRKGCALQLLRRLASLQANNKWAQAANSAADAVVGNSQWFKGYRKDAVSAVGR